eukprot:CAMPEP_0202480124 /NCGR_PEP_ID=MMETSP1361-20130828/238_1 /ASSEMBLY_ACC=CAM_ASM_000849 /TAXON_ID=210615 /ORGANISM="Staurosira complex sp., Strain CCMP2646" /LENGTH=422 /DNA_ID=CAMNT_0049107527 /DNA_START=28 /DNA_END=1299 /DNA_ORIENTATION=+
MAFRSPRTHLLLAVIYCLLCLGMLTSVHAKKDDEPPTMAPTTKKEGKDAEKDIGDEVIVNQDGEVKTMRPTDKPTDAPTQRPTASPSAAPSGVPSVAPSPGPSRAPTPRPTELGQAAASDSLVEVRMASMVMDIASDGGQVNGDTLEADMEELLTYEVLDRVYDSFSHVDLDVTLRSSTSTRRKLQVAEYEAEIQGAAYFSQSNDIPTEQQLSEFLYTYFSIYNSEDLTNGLSGNNAAITNAEIRSVDGVAVDIQSLNVGGNNKGGNSEGSAPANASSLGAIIGLVAGALVLIVAIGALLRIRKKNLESEKGTQASPAERTEAMSPSPQVSIEDEVSVGMSSMDDSIYTHNSNLIIKNPIARMAMSSSAQYDANRLDKVLDSAHSFNNDKRKDSLHSIDSFENVYSQDSEDMPPAISNPLSF